MKSIYLIIFFLLTSIYSFSQDKYSDIIYPVSGEDSITDCQILKIRNWNTIIFEKDFFQDTVMAIAAVKNGRFIDFRTRKEIKDNAYPSLFSRTEEKEIVKGYEYYQLEYQKAVKQKKGGAKLTLFGGLLGSATFFAMYRNIRNNQITSNYIPAIFLGGGILFNIGAPLWISGSIKADKNDEAMLKQQEKDLSLHLGLTNNGAGLVIKF